MLKVSKSHSFVGNPNALGIARFSENVSSLQRYSFPELDLIKREFIGVRAVIAMILYFDTA